MSDWRDAFIAQARSDFQVADQLSRRGDVPVCHVIHYLQMTLEKLAKGMSSRPGSAAPPPHSHHGAARFVRQMMKKGPLSKDFHRGLGMGDAQRRAYLEGLLPSIQLIEDMAPAVANRRDAGVNAEYPWPVAGGVVVAPVQHDFASIPSTKLRKVRQLLRVLLRSCH